MRLVVLGAPGAGKGTQARNLAKHYAIDHISTGDILRGHMKDGTEIGVFIQDMMDNGQLVPDDLIIRLVKERIQADSAKTGFILDGFPRTLIQAQVLDSLSDELSLKLDKVVYVKVDDGVIIKRMSGRLVCPQCDAMYHSIYYPPKDSGKCDICAAELIQREDDKARSVQKRLEIYHRETEPIINFYKENQLLVEVDGVGEMERISNRIIQMIGAQS